jgi:hypothetical protein
MVNIAERKRGKQRTTESNWITHKSGFLKLRATEDNRISWPA